MIATDTREQQLQREIEQARADLARAMDHGERMRLQAKLAELRAAH